MSSGDKMGGKDGSKCIIFEGIYNAALITIIHS